MKYFTIKKTFFLVPSNTCYEEFEKIEKFMSILEKSGVGKIIDKVYKEEKKDRIGRNRINRSIQVEGTFGQIKQNDALYKN